jgi:DNA-binding NtrC family response regulator
VGKRVLVIDSSRVIRTLLSIHLQQVGHQVIVCNNAEEGLLTLYDLHYEVPDVILLAIHIPVKEEQKILQYVKTRPRYARTALIVMPTHEDIAYIRPLLNGGSIACLSKPFHIQDVLRLVATRFDNLPAFRPDTMLKEGIHGQA